MKLVRCLLLIILTVGWSAWSSTVLVSARGNTPSMSHSLPVKGMVSTSGCLSVAATLYRTPTLGSEPVDITTGPDGNFWFTEGRSGSPSQIGRITPTGTITEFSLPTDYAVPSGITMGPDGNLWFTEQGTSRIGKSTLTGTITEFPLPATTFPAGRQPTYIASSGSAVWFTEYGPNAIGQMSISGASATYPVPSTDPSYGPLGIARGTDGSIWFTELGTNKIGHVTALGGIAEYPLPTVGSQPYRITLEPDGNMWFTESGARQVASITSTGVITEYPVGLDPTGIVTGPDAKVWVVGVTNFSGYPQLALSSIDKKSGEIQMYCTGWKETRNNSITSARAGTLWVTAYTQGGIGQVVIP
jgi:streptogramin lyase